MICHVGHFLRCLTSIWQSPVAFTHLKDPCTIPSMVRAASIPQCHIIYQVHVSWALLPTITSNPWLTKLFSVCSWVKSHHSLAPCKTDDSVLRIRDLWWHNRFETDSREVGMAYVLYLRVIYVPVYSSCWESHRLRDVDFSFGITYSYLVLLKAAHLILVYRYI